MLPTRTRIRERSIPRRLVAGLGGLAVIGLVAVAGCSKPFRAEKVVQLSAPLPVSRVEIRSGMGAIEATAESGGDAVRAEALLVGHGATQRDADEAVEQIEVALTPMSGGTVVAEGRHPPDTSWRAATTQTATPTTEFGSGSGARGRHSVHVGPHVDACDRTGRRDAPR